MLLVLFQACGEAHIKGTTKFGAGEVEELRFGLSNLIVSNSKTGSLGLGQRLTIFITSQFAFTGEIIRIFIIFFRGLEKVKRPGKMLNSFT